MPTFVLKADVDTPLANAIREASGADPGEDIEVMTPEFNRPADWDPAMMPPTESAGWKQLQGLKRDDLHAWGCRPWASFTQTPPTNPGMCSHKDAWFWTAEEGEAATHELWLFPAEWYAAIPAGFPVTDINGCIEPFIPGKTDDDRRFGLLAYGMMIKLPARPPEAHPRSETEITNDEDDQARVDKWGEP